MVKDKAIVLLYTNKLSIDDGNIDEDDLYLLIGFYHEYLLESGTLSSAQLKAVKEQGML